MLWNFFVGLLFKYKIYMDIFQLILYNNDKVLGIISKSFLIYKAMAKNYER